MRGVPRCISVGNTDYCQNKAFQSISEYANVKHQSNAIQSQEYSWVLGKILMKDDLWAVFRDKEQRQKAREQKEWCIKWNTKNLRKFAHMVVTALAWSRSLRPAVEESAYEQDRNQPVWPVLVPDVPCTLSPVKNTFGTPSCFCHWLNSDMWFDGNAIWRLSGEQQERGCSMKGGTPGAKGGSCPGRDCVLSQYHSCHRRQVPWLQNLPVVQVPGGDGWDSKDPVTLRALTENYIKVLKEMLS